MLRKILCMSVLTLALAGGFGGSGEAAESKVLAPHDAGIVTVAALTARGDLPQLSLAINEALDSGLTVNEVKEVLIQSYAYCGFPRSLNALNTLNNVLQERRAKGITDEIGRDAAPLDANADRRSLGKAKQTQIAGREVKGGVYDLAPTINEYLQEHLFYAIFARDVLDDRTRELATVSMLAGLGNVNPQLASHMRCSLRAGVSEAELWAAVAVLKSDVQAETGANAENILKEVLNK